MISKDAFLVVGGDSLVGEGLFKTLNNRGHEVFSTTRRKDTISSKRIYLDFESETVFCPPPSVQYIFIVAAATNYDRCEKDPLAKYINEELTPKLVSSLLGQGLFVSFISTNSVFGGEQPWPSEDDSHAPGIAYAKQKDQAEKVIRLAAVQLDAENRLSIVRLTKILAKDTAPLPNWFSAWEQGDVVQPFSDLIFSPMSLSFVANALAVIGEKRISGNLHLSGAENVSYVELALSLAEKWGIDKQLIVPTTSEEKGISIPFKPQYSGLGMTRTTELSGLEPQTLDAVVRDLSANH